MILDTNNNTTGNNEAEGKKEQENPKSIFENRLATHNDRKTGVDQDKPAAEQNSSDSIMAGAIATHEVMPPLAAVPLVGMVENPDPESKPTETHPCDSFP